MEPRKVMNADDLTVVKRNGSIEPFNIDKIHKMVELACENITGVSVSDIEMEARLSFYDGITSAEIHRAITKAATDLISEHAPNYQFVAGRLLNYDIRKFAWGGMHPPKLYDHVKRLAAMDYYTTELLEMYSENDWNKMDSIIDHERDLKMSHIGVKEYLTKYAVRDRSLDYVVPLETPQITYMLISAIMCSDTRELKDIKSYYNDISQHNISLPTPIMAGMRTPSKQFSSCVLISCDDTLPSISATNSAVQTYIAKKAGIGVAMMPIRAENSPVARKTIKHTGVTPYLRQLEGTVKSCSQGGVRGGAATVNLLLWHLDVEDLLVLKNNKGTPDNRVRRLDYCYLINNFMYQRAIENSNITLFSPHEVPDLYEAFFSDSEKFAELYEQYENNDSVRKKTVAARQLLSDLVVERKETGRIYILNVDNVNSHSSFNVPVQMTNLCVEILLPTTPMKTTDEYTIYVPKTDLLKVINELGSSDLVKSFKILEVA